MGRYLSLIVSLLLLSFSVMAERNYHYISWSGVERRPIDSITITESADEKLTFTWHGHYPSYVEKCSEEDMAFCFTTRYYAFSMPKTFKDEEHWYAFGEKFEVVDKISFTLMNHTVSDAYIVKSPSNVTFAGKQSGKGTTWIYSKKYGIIAFGYEESTWYWLSSSCGMGAPASCFENEEK